MKNLILILLIASPLFANKVSRLKIMVDSDPSGVKVGSVVVGVEVVADDPDFKKQMQAPLPLKSPEDMKIAEAFFDMVYKKVSDPNFQKAGK